jgi:hypothetical protein
MLVGRRGGRQDARYFMILDEQFDGHDVWVQAFELPHQEHVAKAA